jgi:hypothetical protein
MPAPQWIGKRASSQARAVAVAVGCEPTRELPLYTLSSSANQGSATVVSVRHVLNTPVRGCQRTPADDDE